MPRPYRFVACLGCLLATGITPTTGEVPNAIAIVDDLGDRVMLFRVSDGAYIGDLLTGNRTELMTPLDCLSAVNVRLGTVTYPRVTLISDPRQSRIVAYDAADDTFLGPVITNIVARGMSLRPDGKLIVATSADGLRSFATNGATPATVVAPDAVRGPNQPWDVLVRPTARAGAGDMLVADAALDAILRFSLDGERLAVFAQRPEFRFVEQLAERLNGNVLAVDALGNAVHEFTGDGVWLRALPVTRPRGVIELRNGSLLVAAEAGVLELDNATGAVLNMRMPGYPFSAPRYATRLRCAAAVLVGDMNGDAMVSFFDIDPFLMALLDPAAYATAYPAVDSVCAGDVDGDGLLSFLDIDPFVAVLLP